MRKIDRHGLHAIDCSCAPCEAGFRPTSRQRDNARRAWEAHERREKEKKEKRAREAAEGAASTGSSKQGKTAAHLAAYAAETKRALDALRPPERPATADELKEMRLAFFPDLKRKGDTEK